MRSVEIKAEPAVFTVKAVEPVVTAKVKTPFVPPNYSSALISATTPSIGGNSQSSIPNPLKGLEELIGALLGVGQKDTAVAQPTEISTPTIKSASILSSMPLKYKQEIAALNPIIWATMDQTSGTVPNSGTLGGSFTKGAGAAYWGGGDPINAAPINTASNGCFYFDGIDVSFLSLNNTGFRNQLVNDWTFEAWVFPIDIASGKGILMRNSGTVTFELGINASGFLFVRGGGGGTALCTTALQNFGWYHICIQKYLGNRFAFCINGAFVNESIAQTSFSSAANYSSTTYIGSNTSSAFKGNYDEVSFAPVSISLADAKRHWDSRLVTIPANVVAEPATFTIEARGALLDTTKYVEAFGESNRDTYIYTSGNPGTSQGTNASFEIGSQVNQSEIYGAGQRVAFLRFDTAAFQGKQIKPNSIKLVMTSSGSSQLKPRVFAVDPSLWTESTKNDARPTLGEELYTGPTLISKSAGETYEIPLPDSVLNAGSLAIMNGVDPSAPIAYIASRQSSAHPAPRIVMQVASLPANIPADPALFTIEAKDATVTAKRAVTINAEPAVFNSSAPMPAVVAKRVANYAASPAEFVVGALDANVHGAHGANVQAEPAVFDVNAVDAAVSGGKSANVLATPATFTVQAIDAEVVAIDDPSTTVFAEPAVFTTEAVMPGVGVPARITAEPATFDINAVDVTFDFNRRANVNAEPARFSVRAPAPLEASGDVTDGYYMLTRLSVDSDDTWLRLDELEGTVAKNMQSLSRPATYVSPIFGSVGPMNRLAVRFGPGAQLNVGQNTPGTIEITMRTTQANGVVATGSAFASNESNAVRHYELALVNGVIQIRWRGYNNGQFGPYYTTFTGINRIDDGQWHHLALTAGYDPNQPDYILNQRSGYSLFIDGKLDRRTRHDDSVPGNAFGLAAVDTMFAGLDAEVMEVVIRNNYHINKYQIEQAYYEVFGTDPARAEIVEFAFEARDAKVKGVGTTVLCLYTAFTNSVVETNPEEHMAGNLPGTTYSGQIGQPSAFNGSRIFGGTQTYYYNTYHDWRTGGEGWTDEVTDEPRFIDLRTDVDIDDFDVIYFQDMPRAYARDGGNVLGNGVTPQQYRLRYERMIEGIKWAIKEKGKSVLVLQPQLARDMGIVDGFDVHKLQENPPVVTNDPILTMHRSGQYDYEDMLKDPWINPTHNPNNILTDIDAASFYDNVGSRPYKTRVVSGLDGFTTIPGQVQVDSFNFFNRQRRLDYTSWRWENRPSGYKIGDEVDDNYRSYMTSVPVSKINYGRVIAKEEQYQYTLRQKQVNPYADNATIIALEPGDEFEGTEIQGRVFVAFNYGAGNPGNSGFTTWDDQELVAIGEAGKETAKWQRSMMRLGYAGASFSGGGRGQQLIFNPATGELTLSERGAAQAGISGAVETDFPSEEVYAPRIMDRAWLWLANKAEDGGAAVVAAEVATFTIEAADATVTGSRNINVQAEPALFVIDAVPPLEANKGAVNVAALPATFETHAVMVPTVVRAEPATFDIRVVDPYSQFDTTDYIEIIWQRESQITLYVTEDD